MFLLYSLVLYNNEHPSAFRHRSEFIMDLSTIIKTCRIGFIYDAESDTTEILNKDSALLNIHLLEGTIQHAPDGDVEKILGTQLPDEIVDNMIDTEDGGEAYVILDAQMPGIYWM